MLTQFYAQSAVGGYRRILSLNMSVGNEEQYVGDMEWGILAITSFLLVVTLILCMFIDRQSAMAWTSYQLFSFESQIMRHLTLVSWWLIHFVIIECDEAAGKAFFVWLLVALTSTVFPPFITTFLGMSNDLPAPEGDQILKSCRCCPTALFALRYGICSALLGILPAIDGALILRLLSSNSMFMFLRNHNIVPEDDGLWSSIPTELVTGYLGIRMSMWATGFESLPVESAIALFFLPLINYTVHSTTALGTSLGTYISLDARTDLLPNQAGVRKDFSPVGMGVFWTYVTMLGIIGVSY